VEGVPEGSIELQCRVGGALKSVWVTGGFIEELAFMPRPAEFMGICQEERVAERWGGKSFPQTEKVSHKTTKT
jgi:hypothetical protein